MSIRSNGLSFLMFLQRELRIKGLLLPMEREGERERKKDKTNKSCENLWSECWLLRMQNRPVEFFPLGISNAPLFGSFPPVRLHAKPCLVCARRLWRSAGCLPRALCSAWRSLASVCSFACCFETNKTSRPCFSTEPIWPKFALLFSGPSSSAPDSPRRAVQSSRYICQSGR